MKRDYNKKREGGITFVEMVISLLLLSIATGAIIGAFVISKTSATRARHRISAINLAREKIEAIRGLPYSQISSQAGTENVVIDQGLLISGDELTGERTTNVIDAYGNVKVYKITVTITWTELSNTLNEKVITLISHH